MDRRVAKAHELWDSGEPLEAGRILYEMLPVQERPGWAVGVFDVCCSALETVPPELDTVRALARTPSRWHEAHDAFQAVRRIVLAAEIAQPEAAPLPVRVLLLAENVAKVTYNASGGSAPFDHNAGWRIASCARSVTDAVNDGGFHDDVWNALSSVICL